MRHDLHVLRRLCSVLGKLSVVSSLILPVFTSIGNCDSHPPTALEQFDYPELSVTPLASERVHLESAHESSFEFSTYLPLFASGATTLAAGIFSYDPDNPNAGYVGIGTGAVWLAFSTVMALRYHPYTKASGEIIPLPKNSTREKLTRERAAELEIRNTASLGTKIQWISAITNVGASIFMITQLRSQNNRSNTFILPMEIGAGVVALAPLIFPFYWLGVHDSQMEYKKRIYGPVAKPTLLIDPVGKELIPGISVSMSF